VQVGDDQPLQLVPDRRCRRLPQDDVYVLDQGSAPSRIGQILVVASRSLLTAAKS
jgi:hypothetical protein